MCIIDVDVNALDFNHNDVPSAYGWGGGGKEAVDRFKSWNFLKTRYNDSDLFVCSSENGTGLGEYLTQYIIRQSCVNELLSVLGGDWEYWFFKAIEQSAPFYDEQDLSVKKLTRNNPTMREKFAERKINK